MWHFFSECKPSLSHLIFIIFHQNLPRILSEFHLRIIFDVSNCQNIHSQNQNCRFKKFRQKICATKCSDLRNRRGQIAIWAMPKYTWFFLGGASLSSSNILTGPFKGIINSAYKLNRILTPNEYTEGVSCNGAALQVWVFVVGGTLLI